MGFSHPTAMMINALMARLLDELQDGGVPDPLTESFTFAALWDDLARLAGETPPTIVRQLYEADRPLLTPGDWRGDPAGTAVAASPT